MADDYEDFPENFMLRWSCAMDTARVREFGELRDLVEPHLDEDTCAEFNRRMDVLARAFDAVNDALSQDHIRFIDADLALREWLGVDLRGAIVLAAKALNKLPYREHKKEEPCESSH